MWLCRIAYLFAHWLCRDDSSSGHCIGLSQVRANASVGPKHGGNGRREEDRAAELGGSWPDYDSTTAALMFRDTLSFPLQLQPLSSSFISSLTQSLPPTSLFLSLSLFPERSGRGSCNFVCFIKSQTSNPRQIVLSYSRQAAT